MTNCSNVSDICWKKTVIDAYHSIWQHPRILQQRSLYNPYVEHSCSAVHVWESHCWYAFCLGWLLRRLLLTWASIWDQRIKAIDELSDHYAEICRLGVYHPLSKRVIGNALHWWQTKVTWNIKSVIIGGVCGACPASPNSQRDTKVSILQFQTTSNWTTAFKHIYFDNSFSYAYEVILDSHDFHERSSLGPSSRFEKRQDKFWSRIYIEPANGSLVWTTLITNTAYLSGLLTLDYSLKKNGTSYPLVALYTDTFPPEGHKALDTRKIPKKYVKYLLPRTHKDFSNDPRFYDCWSKLTPFSLTEYERVVQLDSDMLALKNMDELMDLKLDSPASRGTGDRVFAASHACVCNPLNKPHYPKNWWDEFS